MSDRCIGVFQKGDGMSGRPDEAKELIMWMNWLAAACIALHRHVFATTFLANYLSQC